MAQAGPGEKRRRVSYTLTSFAETSHLNTALATHHTVSLSPPVRRTRDESNYFLPLSVSRRFGEKLKMLRTQRNMTQLQMAIIFGLDRSFISDLERGRKAASIATLEIIALGMKISLSELLQDL
jgi:DNA-binding XRE family transcriptional regulator